RAGQLAEQELLGPAVRDDVRQVEEEEVTFRLQPEEPRPQERRLTEVERPRRLSQQEADPARPRGLVEAGEIFFGAVHLNRLMDRLGGLAGDLQKGRAQRLV